MIELHNANCFEIMAKIPDGSIDLIITDPPYFSTNLHFDKGERLDFKAWLLECQRVLKPAGVLVSFADFNLLAELRGYGAFKSTYELIWHKTMAVGFLDANNRPLRAHEFIGVFTDKFKEAVYNPQKVKSASKNKGKTINTTSNIYSQCSGSEWVDDNTRHPTTILNGFYDSERFNTGLSGNMHPTQKPLDLVSWLMRTYSNEGDLVLDCFMGSGTVGHAAALLNRGFIGCELDATYYSIAKARIEDAHHDLVNLFGEI